MCPRSARLPQFRAYNAACSRPKANGYGRRLFHTGMNEALARRAPNLAYDNAQLK
jgi:hypothetical protein